MTPAWLSVEKSGNTIQCTAQPHTGRNTRSATVTATTAGGASDSCAVTQEAKTEFIDITEAAVNIAQSATTFTVHAKSNSTKVTAALSANGIGAAITRITAAGNTVTSGQAIAGDPGATSEYDIVVTGSCSINADVNVKNCTLTLTDNASHSDSVVISQTAGDSSISLSSDSITLAQAGETKSITVTSNDTWTVEAVEA